MSSDEIRAQKASLLLEHQEAKEQLANLRERTLRIGRQFKWFGSLVEAEPERIVAPTSKHCHGELNLIEIHQQQLELLSFDAAIAAADEVRLGVRTILDIEQRMKNLGMPISD
jgi:hypothetical protein